VTVFWIIVAIVVLVIAVLWWKGRPDELLRAAQAGDPDAQYQLAVDCYDGLNNRVQDRKAAAEWCMLAAQQRHRDAQAMLGKMYDLGAGGLERSREQAVHWYKKAAEKGHGECQCLLGRAYFHGKGIPQNYMQAYCWLNVARAQGDAGKAETEMMNEIEGKLEPQQLLHAQKLSVQMHEKMKGG